MSDQPITAALLRQVLAYDPQTGAFTWRVGRGGFVKAGEPAGFRCRGGYANVTILGRAYKAHRLAWLYVHGHWPKHHLDHINGVRDDNRLDNLRECTVVENQQNKALYRNNTSGYTGVIWHEPNKAWLARIGIAGKKRCLGYHPTPEAAHAAYLKAKAELHAFQPTPRGATL